MLFRFYIVHVHILILTIASVTAMPDAPEWLVPDDCHVSWGVSVSLGARGLDSGTVHHLLHLWLKAIGNVKVVVLVHAHHGEALCPHHLEKRNTQLLNNNNNKTDVQHSHVPSPSWNPSWTGGAQVMFTMRGLNLYSWPGGTQVLFILTIGTSPDLVEYKFCLP